MNHATATAWVSTANIDLITQEIARLNRRAKRLGLPELAITCAETRPMRVITCTELLGRTKRIAIDEPIPAGWTAKHAISETLISISGEVPHLNGWRMVGIVDHMMVDGSAKHANIVRSMPGETVPERFRAGAAHCDHCNTIRNRNSTYILQHAETGQTRQIGRTCLVDFIGTDTAEALAARADLIGQAAQILRNAEGDVDDGDSDSHDLGGLGSRGMLYLGDYLPYVAMALRLYGWTSKSAAADTGASATADDALMLMHDAKGGVPTADDAALARNALVWAEEQGERQDAGDLDHNMAALARAGFAGVKHLGIAAWTVEGYRRAAVKAARAAAHADNTASEYRGTVGKREAFNGLTVDKVIRIEGVYPSALHKFRDDSGNVFAWFSSSVVLAVGTRYNVTATVKKHDEYNGVKQTTLTRVKGAPA